MAKTLVISGGTASNASTANTTQYLSLIGDNRNSSTESDVQVPFRVAGSFYSLGIRISTNSVNATTTFTLRQNAADTALSFPVATTQTGWFEDISDTVTVASGDLFSVKSAPGAGSTGTYTAYNIKLEFDTTTSTTLSSTRIGASVATLNTGHTTASTSFYYQVQSGIPTGSTVNSTEST